MFNSSHRHSFNTGAPRTRRNPSNQPPSENTSSSSSPSPPPAKVLLCTCSVEEEMMKVWEMEMDQTTTAGIRTITEVEGYTACCFAQVGKALWVGCAKRDILVFDPEVCLSFSFSSSLSLFFLPLFVFSFHFFLFFFTLFLLFFALIFRFYFSLSFLN